MAIGRLVPGSKLGRYTLREPLGAGGMGVVYEAHDDKLERSVAIKVLPQGLVSGEEARLRFHREALALARLGHEHIAAIYDFGEDSGLDYIVMERIADEPLSAKLAAGPLSVREATTICHQIALALVQAHENGILHRDLKPANVMLTPRGAVKVLDFGLAKFFAHAPEEQTQVLAETQGIAGTPLYMSPEQISGKQLGPGTDLWSLGCIYYECLTGQSPFKRSGSVATLRAITEEAPAPVRQLRPEVTLGVADIAQRLLEKDPARRYASAQEVVTATSDVLLALSGAGVHVLNKVKSSRRAAYISVTALAVVIAAAAWLYVQISRARWAREEAPAQITALLAQNKALAAFDVLRKAQRYAPHDAQLREFADQNTVSSNIRSNPAGAEISIQDYNAPDSQWRLLGKAPLSNVGLPNGYFRWKASYPGMADMLVAPETDSEMRFDIAAQQTAPAGMVLVEKEGPWREFIAFLQWIGPYDFPPYYIDRFEVTNRDFQRFVDDGGYAKKQFWNEKFTRDGRDMSPDEAMTLFRDTSGRNAPAGWTAGHFPPGQDDYPVTGVSWFEAAAYAAWAGKSLPVMAQWYQVADPDTAGNTTAMSNFSGKPPPVGSFQGLGVHGTYDMAGNAREWVANTIDNGLRFILGSSWSTQPYLYAEAEALSPFDRSATNGFRCVKNTAALPPGSEAPVRRNLRDFSTAKPVGDEVFRAYEVAYQYPDLPLNAAQPQLAADTPDWREEKVTVDAAYGGDRLPVFLFLPKHVKPPFQTVLFFPSARVLGLADSRQLGDIQFFDYVVQSGRAVIYPVYADTYERRSAKLWPAGATGLDLLTHWYKDAARAADYAATRKDLDTGKMAYMGVSMGSADGAIVAEQLQARLKTAIFLDGGYFLDPPQRGTDQVDFVSRIRIPVLMINGRYDFTFPLDLAQKPFFDRLATPAASKQHVVLETPHDVTQDRPRLVRTVLDWLDKYLGRVS